MSSFRRRLMMAQQGGGAVEGIPSAESTVGDVCVYGINEGKLIIVNDWNASKCPISKYPPIGIVVVPGGHGHYEDGKCAIMSLNYMSCNTPIVWNKDNDPFWQGMVLELGKFYIQNGVLYECIRDSGGVKIVHDLSALVGNYVKVVE